MPTLEEKAIWEDILDVLRDDDIIPGISFNSWIAPLKLLEISDKTIYLQGTEAIRMAPMQKRYYPKMLAVVKTILGDDYALVLQESPYVAHPQDIPEQFEMPFLTNTQYAQNPQYNANPQYSPNAQTMPNAQNAQYSQAQYAQNSTPYMASMANTASAAGNPGGYAQGGINPGAAYPPRSQRTLGQPSQASMQARRDTMRAAQSRSDDWHSLVIPDYTFENFVVGPNNTLAYAAALGIAQGTVIDGRNPLYLYGGVGLGKTHLMHAICNAITKRDPEARVLYMTSEDLTNEVVNSIAQNDGKGMRARLRNVDVLLVDDIQLIAGREATQEEFFHTFNQLFAARKKIVIASDRKPADLHQLQARLVSRFGAGLVIDIQQPDYETRLAILTHHAQTQGVSIPLESLAVIAENPRANIRQLEGYLNTVIANWQSSGQAPNPENVRKWLSGLIQFSDPRKITASLIIEVTAAHYGLTVEQILSSRKTRDLTIPRQIAMYLCREMTSLSLPQIGGEFHRDHTTVMSAIDRVVADLEKTPSLAPTIATIKRKITEA